MSQIREKERVRVEHLPRMFRRRTIDYTLMVVGAVIAALGAYTYFAPTSWALAGYSEGWFLSSWILGGALLTAGFGLLGASVRDRAGFWTTSAIVSFVLGTLTLAGAVAAAVVLIM